MTRIYRKEQGRIYGAWSRHTCDRRITNHPDYQRMKAVVQYARQNGRDWMIRRIVSICDRLTDCGPGDMYRESRRIMIETGDVVEACKAFYPEDERINDWSNRPVQNGFGQLLWRKVR